MTKCSAHQCNKELNVENREVYSLRIVAKEIKTKNGKIIKIWDGWRFVCKEHHDLVKSGELQANMELIYGKRKKRRQGRGKKRSYSKARTNKHSKRVSTHSKNNRE